MSQQVPVNDPQGSPAEGTGEAPTTAASSSAGTSNTDSGMTPDTIPYSRFQEVNSRLQSLRDYERLQQMQIDSDSAIRLASFEQAYIQDPIGTLAAMVDQQDLPDAQKTALKALLQTKQDAALSGADDGDKPPEQKLPDEVLEAVSWVREQRQAAQQADVDARLDHMVRHWQQQDEQDSISGITARQRLLYIKNTAQSGQQFATLEELSDAARTSFMEDRDSNLGSAVTRTRAQGGPLAVPSGGLPPTQPTLPKTMKEARAMIQADIDAGRLPDLQPE
jgi:hypothetical protein